MEQYYKTTLLLTGVTGFLGSHILKALTKSSKYKIICLKRSFSNISRLSSIKSDNVFFYDVDIVDLDSVFRVNNIEIIIHMATEYGRDQSQIYKVMEANLVFPIKVIETAIKYKVKYFINTDSYFNKDTFSYSYLLNYSLSKKSLIHWLKSLSGKIGIVNICLEHIYGENDNPQKFTEYVIKAIAIDQKKEIDLTYGHQRRDFVYIRDVVKAYLTIIEYCIQHKFLYKTFEVGSGEAQEIRLFVDLVKQISQSRTLLNFGKLQYRSDEIMESKANNQDLLELGWKADVSLENGITNIINYYRSI